MNFSKQYYFFFRYYNRLEFYSINDQQRRKLFFSNVFILFFRYIFFAFLTFVAFIMQLSHTTTTCIVIFELIICLKSLKSFNISQFQFKISIMIKKLKFALCKKIIYIWHFDFIVARKLSILHDHNTISISFFVFSWTYSFALIFFELLYCMH